MNLKPMLGLIVVALLAMYTAGSVIAAQPAPQETTPTPSSPQDTTPPEGPGQDTTLPEVPAQDDVTPAAPGNTDPAQNEQVTIDSQVLEAEFQRTAQIIQLVQADREFVASTIDVTLVDELISNAELRLDEAQTALDAGNSLQARGLNRAAAESANAAGALMRAQLAGYGLPSQQAQASRELVRSYYAVQEITGQSATITGVDVGFYVTTAQNLYAEAYDLYNAGTYEQAMQTAQVAEEVGRIARTIHEANGLVSEPVGPGLQGPGTDGPQAPSREGPALGGDDASNQTPLTVPAPEF